MILALPYPPTANHLHAVFKGRKILSAAGRAYYEEVGLIARSQIRAVGVREFGADVRIEYELDVFPPDRRRRDLSNVLKAFEDALTAAGMWADDSQVDHFTVRRRAPCAGGQLCAVIRALA
jgi:crossover junction endodeoxyribonuclease RusA